jgi:hypothetical protein
MKYFVLFQLLLFLLSVSISIFFLANISFTLGVICSPSGRKTIGNSSS